MKDETKIKEKILTRWKSGQTVTELAKQYHYAPIKVRRILIAMIGREEYHRVNKTRVGMGSVKRKAKPSYPKWMLERKKP